MAQAPQEVEEITSFCQATLLNTGVPEAEKLEACILAGKQANLLGHPVILDPVGAGASRFRRKWLARLLDQVNVQVIRCNQEEACNLLQDLAADEWLTQKGLLQIDKGGVESAVSLTETELRELACRLGKACRCTVLISGKIDAVSDGNRKRLYAVSLMRFILRIWLGSGRSGRKSFQNMERKRAQSRK